MTIINERRREIGTAYAVAVGSNEPAAVEALCAADFVVWHNFDERETNLSASGNALAQLHILVPDIAWTQSTIIASDDGFVWRYVITGSAPGGQLRLPGCIVAQIRDDRITRVEEYLDTKQAKVLRP